MVKKVKKKSLKLRRNSNKSGKQKSIKLRRNVVKKVKQKSIKLRRNMVKKTKIIKRTRLMKGGMDVISDEEDSDEEVGWTGPTDQARVDSHLGKKNDARKKCKDAGVEMCEICWECKEDDHDFETGDARIIHPLIKCKNFLTDLDKNQIKFNDRNTHVNKPEELEINFIENPKKLVIFDFDECLMNESVAADFNTKTFKETDEGLTLNDELLMKKETRTLLNKYLKEGNIQFAIASFGRREVIRSVLFKLFPDDHQKIYITTPGDYDGALDTTGYLKNKNTQIHHIMKRFFGTGDLKGRNKDVIFYDDNEDNVAAARLEFENMTIHCVKPFPVPLEGDMTAEYIKSELSTFSRPPDDAESVDTVHLKIVLELDKAQKKIIGIYLYYNTDTPGENSMVKIKNISTENIPQQINHITHEKEMSAKNEWFNKNQFIFIDPSINKKVTIYTNNQEFKAGDWDNVNTIDLTGIESEITGIYKKEFDVQTLELDDFNSSLNTEDLDLVRNLIHNPPKINESIEKTFDIELSDEEQNTRNQFPTKFFIKTIHTHAAFIGTEEFTDLLSGQNVGTYAITKEQGEDPGEYFSLNIVCKGDEIKNIPFSVHQNTNKIRVDLGTDTEEAPSYDLGSLSVDKIITEIKDNLMERELIYDAVTPFKRGEGDFYAPVNYGVDEELYVDMEGGEGSQRDGMGVSMDRIGDESSPSSAPGDTDGGALYRPLYAGLILEMKWDNGKPHLLEHFTKKYEDQAEEKWEKAMPLKKWEGEEGPYTSVQFELKYGIDASEKWEAATEDPFYEVEKWDGEDGPFTFAQFQDFYKDTAEVNWEKANPLKKYDEEEGPYTFAEFQDEYGIDALEKWKEARDALPPPTDNDPLSGGDVSLQQGVGSGPLPSHDGYSGYNVAAPKAPIVYATPVGDANPLYERVEGETVETNRIPGEGGLPSIVQVYGSV